ncbi:MAG: nucleotidyltransferase family protein [Planctomycetes bacterium]|nr:nucleotidyltransferase family protein [Planctomycetota bacterium]
MVRKAKAGATPEPAPECYVTPDPGSRPVKPLDGHDHGLDEPNDPSNDRSPEERSRSVRVRNTRMMRLLERIAARFSEADVPLMVLKGAALHLTLYEEPDDRAMADLDLMIRPEDVDKAFHLLEGLGGLRGEPLVREDFFPRFHYEIEYTIGTIYPVKIDLHVRPFRPLRYGRLVPVDALWDRAELVSIGRANILVPAADDMLVHLAAHAAVHGDIHRKWLVDIKRWVEVHGGDIDWDRFLATVRQWRLALPVRRTFQRVQRELGPACPPQVTLRLSKMRVNWRDRLALWQAPRDAAYPVTHVVANVVCTPGLRFVLAYVWAVLVPDRAHMADWYQRRHWGWLTCAHMLRFLGPISKWTPRLWAWFTKIETQKSPTHGIGVFTTRDIKKGEVIARYHGRPVQRCGTYVVSVKTETGEKERYELTGKLKFLNHACRPNAELSGFQLVALKPIRAGQEIKIDYGEGTCNCKTKQHEESVSSRERAADASPRARTGKRPPRDRARHSPTGRLGTTGGAEPALASRRRFLSGVSKKALYLTPVVMTLTAQQAGAAPSPSCLPSGATCTFDEDCCSDDCVSGMCQT